MACMYRVIMLMKQTEDPKNGIFTADHGDVPLIRGMMASAGVTERELKARGESPTAFGETLSWEYLRYVRSHPIRWSAPTRIL